MRIELDGNVPHTRSLPRTTTLSHPKRSAQDKGLEINSVCGRFEPIPKQETSKDVYNIDIGQNTHTTTKKSIKLCSTLEKARIHSISYCTFSGTIRFVLTWSGTISELILWPFFPRKVKFWAIHFVLKVSILCMGLYLDRLYFTARRALNNSDQ